MSVNNRYYADITWGCSSSTVDDDRPDAFAYNVAQQIESYVRNHGNVPGDPMEFDIRITVTAEYEDYDPDEHEDKCDSLLSSDKRDCTCQTRAEFEREKARVLGGG